MRIDLKETHLRMEIIHTGYGYDYPGDSDIFVDKLKVKIDSVPHTHRRFIMDRNNNEISEEREDSWILHEFRDLETESGNRLGIVVNPGRVCVNVIMKNISDDWKTYVKYILDCFSFSAFYAKIDEINFKKLYSDDIFGDYISSDMKIENIKENIFPVPVIDKEYNANNEYKDCFVWKERDFGVCLHRKVYVAQDYTRDRHGELTVVFSLENTLYKKNIKEGNNSDKVMGIIDEMDICHRYFYDKIYK